jgi:hypothetical protein
LKKCAKDHNIYLLPPLPYYTSDALRCRLLLYRSHFNTSNRNHLRQSPAHQVPYMKKSHQCALANHCTIHTITQSAEKPFPPLQLDLRRTVINNHRALALRQLHLLLLIPVSVRSWKFSTNIIIPLLSIQKGRKEMNRVWYSVCEGCFYIQHTFQPDTVESGSFSPPRVA